MYDKIIKKMYFVRKNKFFIIIFLETGKYYIKKRTKNLDLL